MTRCGSDQVQTEAGDWLRHRLRAIVLLAGAVRPTGLSALIGRSVLDLPTDEGQSVLAHWHSLGAELTEHLQLQSLPMRVMINPGSTHPTAVATTGNHVSVSIEHDSTEYRGTAGVLRDVAEDYEDSDVLLVANGAQVVWESLSNLVGVMAGDRADLSLISNEDGTPSGLMLVRCAVLRDVSAIGFVDLKEQALPRIAREHMVSVVERSEPCGLPIRTLSDYIEALRSLHRRRAGQSNVADAFAEGWQPTFGIVEDGAEVDTGVRTHDSVVLRGARVERGAVLVQSVVCPGGVVKRHQVVTDSLVEPPASKNGGRRG